MQEALKPPTERHDPPLRGRQRLLSEERWDNEPNEAQQSGFPGRRNASRSAAGIEVPHLCRAGLRDSFAPRGGVGILGTCRCGGLARSAKLRVNLDRCASACAAGGPAGRCARRLPS